MSEENNKFLGTQKISKLLLKFSIPCILSLIISSLYNIVDQIFIGNSTLGYLGNTATSIVFPITIISMAFAWCFGDGAAAYLSLSQGRKDTKNIHKAIGNTITITLIISLIFMLVCFLGMDKILYAFGASNTSISLARSYFTILLYFMPIYMLGNCLNGTIRADGSPIYSMASTIVGAITNIILDPIFIFKFNMGIEGAAWATIIGQMATFIVSFFYLTRTKTFKLKLNSFILNFKVLSNIVKLGISTFITQMAIVLISLVCNIMLAHFGTISKYGPDIPIAVIGIVMKVFSIVINIIVGIIVGAQPILGYNYGAKKYNRVRETFKIVARLTIIVGLIATIIFEAFPNLIISVFGNQNALYNEFATLTIRIFLSLVTLTCFIKMSSIFFQAVGKPVKSIIVSLARDILFFIPLVIILPNIMHNIKGVLWAAPIADLLGIFITIPMLIVFFQKLGKEDVSKAEEITLKESHPGIIITISREHGSQGKYIGELVAQQLNIPYYYKDLFTLVAQETGLADDYVSKINENSPQIMYDLYLSTTPIKDAMNAQNKVIKEIANKGSCVIVGRAADYVLKDYPNVIKIFIHADKDYRIKKVMEMYNDTEAQAKKAINKSDKARANYYESISGNKWGEAQNYDLCINSKLGAEKTAQIIVEYLKNVSNK